MSHLRSVNSFGKYLLVNISFSAVPCALLLVWQWWNEVKAIQLLLLLQNGTSLCIFMHKNFSFKALGKLAEGYHGFGKRNFFSSIFLFSLLLSKKKKVVFFQQRLFHRLPSYAWHRYAVKLFIVKLHVVFDHDTLKVFPLPAVLLGQLIHRPNKHQFFWVNTRVLKIPSSITENSF